jgi:hypothetical protein
MQVSASLTFDGFWLPQGLREDLLTPGMEFVTCSFLNGRPCEAEAAGAVTTRWPRLQGGQWKTLLASLEENRRFAPHGAEFWERLQSALREIGKHFSEPSDLLRTAALDALPGYTGYSEPMVRLTVEALDMFSLEQLPFAYTLSPTAEATRGWQSMCGLAGSLHFFPQCKQRARVLRGFPYLRQTPSIGNGPLFDKIQVPNFVLGYGAGNLPGAALLIALLAQSTTLADGRLPAVIVKNSRNEPIFSPLVFRALEAVDPELVSTVAILVWDYEDETVQNYLTGQADLIVAAASNETIGQIQIQIDKIRSKQDRPSSRPIRFHAHGHKVSFSAIGKEALTVQTTAAVQTTVVGKSLEPKRMGELIGGQSLLDVVTMLAALDSIFWDQHGCLSSRIHFVEEGGEGYYTPLEYAQRLQKQLSLLATFLPRGAWPLQQLHDCFDRYKHLELAGNIQVISRYDDEWLVIFDRRRLQASTFRNLVNDCQGRVVVVRPVSDLMEIPGQYLKMLPAENLQSLSVAMGRPGMDLPESFLRFAEACGRCGITAIRTVGRGAFPQLAYSWDGYLPLDLVRERPAGYFTTIEFDHPFEQILETYRILQSQRLK